MTSHLIRLLEAPTWRAFDLDDAGRVLAGSDASGSVQLVELNPDGSLVALTALPGPCSGRYVPGRRAVIVQHDDGGNERTQLSLLRLEPAPAEPVALDGLEPLVHDPDHLHRLTDVLPGRVVYLTNRRNGVDFDVVIRALEGGAEQVVHESDGMVLSVAVSPEARHVVLTRPGVPALSDQVLLIDTMPDTEDGRITELTAPELPARHVGLHWLAGGETVLLSSDADRDLTAVVAVDVGDGTRRELVASPDHDLTAWPSPDGRLLLVEAEADGASVLTLHDAATGDLLRPVELPGDGVATWPMPDPIWSPDSHRVALSFSGPSTPGDVLLVDVADGSSQVLAGSGAPVADLGLQGPRRHRVPTPDGAQIPCFVYPAATEDSAVAGSAVLILHGGPEAQARLGFSPIVSALTLAGHTVVVPNVRGSTGYGKRWYSADDGRKRLTSVADMAAIHAWLPEIGVDPARTALWGGSYGGYMVLAGLAFQPQLWAAGVGIVGISSLVTFLENTSGYRRAHREREYGSLEHDRDFLEIASPLSRVDSITAPLMVIHGANDPRVPLSEAEQVAEAVRARDIECELLVYDDEGHGLTKRHNRIDAYPRAVEFLARHLATPS